MESFSSYLLVVPCLDDAYVRQFRAYLHIMRNPIDMATDVGPEEGVWTVSACGKSNPLDVWAKHYDDRESAQNDAFGLGLIDAIGN